MSAWMQIRGPAAVADGARAIDLDAPDLDAVDIAEAIAVPLARLARFAGQTGGTAAARPWSVAQHCVVGADAVWEETRSSAASLAFLVHDAHEALIGDITSPAVRALDSHVETVLAVALGNEAAGRVRAAFAGGAVEIALAGLKGAIDGRIHRAVGLPMVLPHRLETVVADMDRRMLDLERRQILGPRLRNRTVREVWPAAVLDARPVRIRGRLTPWAAGRAAAQWLDRLARWRLDGVAAEN